MIYKHTRVSSSSKSSSSSLFPENWYTFASCSVFSYLDEFGLSPFTIFPNEFDVTVGRSEFKA